MYSSYLSLYTVDKFVFILFLWTFLEQSLLIIYENKRSNKQAEAEKRKEELYKKNPRFSEIDTQLSTLSISASKNLINSSNFEYLDNLRKQIEKLINKWYYIDIIRARSDKF